MDLAAMVRLMIEEMHHQRPLGPAHLRLGRTAPPHQIGIQPGLVDPAGEIFDPRVGGDPLARSSVEILEQRRALQVGHGVGRPAVEARHPLPVGPHQVIERAVQRPPEQAAVGPALLVGKPRRAGIDPAVHLRIVTGHGADKGRRDHGSIRSTLQAGTQRWGGRRVNRVMPEEDPMKSIVLAALVLMSVGSIAQAQSGGPYRGNPVELSQMPEAGSQVVPGGGGGQAPITATRRQAPSRPRARSGVETRRAGPADFGRSPGAGQAPAAAARVPGREWRRLPREPGARPGATAQPQPSTHWVAVQEVAQRAGLRRDESTPSSAAPWARGTCWPKASRLTASAFAIPARRPSLASISGLRRNRPRRLTFFRLEQGTPTDPTADVPAGRFRPEGTKRAHQARRMRSISASFGV